MIAHITVMEAAENIRRGKEIDERAHAAEKRRAEMNVEAAAGVLARRVWKTGRVTFGVLKAALPGRNRDVVFEPALETAKRLGWITGDKVIEKGHVQPQDA